MDGFISNNRGNVMFRKYVIITLAAFMVFGTSACTSKKATDENADVEEIASDEALETAEATENNGDLAIEDDSGNAVADLGSDSLAPEEKLPEESQDAALADNGAPPANDLTETPGDDMSATQAPPDSGSAPTADASTPPPDMSTAGTTEPPAEPAMTEPPVSEPSAMDSAPTPEPVADSGNKPVVASLKKVNAQPYHQGKTLVNAVYIARKGDTVDSISQKVFGSPDHVKDLCRINQYNCSRGLKVGDKFYYNSPQRPTDDTTVKNFYEDAGIAPQMYTAKAGDNIRKLGKELLGHERSWMELWATNDVESKGDLDEGTMLKYWPATETAAPAMAQTEAPPAAEAPPADQAANMPPPMAEEPAAPPVPDQAANQPPPPMDSLPPAPDQAAAGSIEPPPPPPPPPPMEAHKEPVDASGAEGMQDPNQTMALGVGAVLLLAAAALFISIRKKRARRQIDFNTSTQTQIE
jgi:hypothetical protein